MAVNTSTYYRTQTTYQRSQQHLIRIGKIIMPCLQQSQRIVRNSVFTVHMLFEFVPPVEPFAADVTLHVVVSLAFLAVAHHSLLVFVALPAAPASI